MVLEFYGYGLRAGCGGGGYLVSAALFLASENVETNIQTLGFLAWLQVRFKVRSVSYPPLPLEQPEEKDAKPFAPMVVHVSHFLTNKYRPCNEILEVRRCLE